MRLENGTAGDEGPGKGGTAWNFKQIWKKTRRKQFSKKTEVETSSVSLDSVNCALHFASRRIRQLQQPAWSVAPAFQACANGRDLSTRISKPLETYVRISILFFHDLDCSNSDERWDIHAYFSMMTMRNWRSGWSHQATVSNWIKPGCISLWFIPPSSLYLVWTMCFFKQNWITLNKSHLFHNL